MADKSRRLSFINTANDATNENKEINEILEEWDKRWGEHKLDYVNVLKYPEGYVEKIREERRLWLHWLDDIEKNSPLLTKKQEGNFVINEDILNPEHAEFLREIDSKIYEYMKKSDEFLKEFQVYARKQEIMMEAKCREMDYTTKLLGN